MINCPQVPNAAVWVLRWIGRFRRGTRGGSWEAPPSDAAAEQRVAHPDQRGHQSQEDALTHPTDVAQQITQQVQ